MKKEVVSGQKQPRSSQGGGAGANREISQLNARSKGTKARPRSKGKELLPTAAAFGLAKPSPDPEATRVGIRQPIPSACGIIKVKEILATVTQVTGTANTDSVIIQGTLHLQIFYVANDNIVHLQQEDVPFNHLLSIPGTTPGMPVTANANVEYIIFHLDQVRAILKKKIVLIVEATVNDPPPIRVTGGPVVLEGETKGYAREQILVEATNVFPCIKKERIRVGGAEEVSEQILLERTIPVEAIKVKSIGTELVDVTYEVLPDLVMVAGVVHKQIYLVGPDNIVRMVEEDMPFSHTLSLPGVKPGDFVQVEVAVEFVIPELNVVAGTLRQKVVLRITVTAITPAVYVVVVTDVIGPGIVTTKVKIRVDSTILSVVTDVSGPGVKNVIKQTIYVDVVDDGNPNLVPLVVVTDLTIDP